MKYIIKSVILSLVMPFQALASPQLFFEAYDWESTANYEKVKFDDQGAVILKDLKAIEFYFDSEYNTLLQLSTFHTKVQVNTHEAVEIYNKHYMPMNRVLAIEDLRVRVLSESGVREIEEIDLKDYQGQDDYSSYKYFAIDGVEVGSQIEYIYTFKMIPQLEGSREFFQSDELKLNTEFHIFCEDKMFFNTKSYNGFTEVILDTVSVDGKNHYYAKMEKIDPLESELYAPYTNNLMRIEYKVDYILPASDVKLYTYHQLSNQLNAYLLGGKTKKTEKAVSKLSKSLKLDGKSEIEKIRIIENFIKRNIALSESGGDEINNLEYVIEKHVANQRGIMKLFVALFEINEIDYYFGLTSDRTRVVMDPEFESYSFLENYFFYFPGIDKYMAPTESLYRLGFIPYNWSNNYGLFVRNVKLGGTTAGIGEVRFIEPLEYKESEDVLDIQLDFVGEFEELDIDIQRSLTGYNATYIQPIFEIIPENETKSVAMKLLNFSGKDVELQSFEVKNATLDSFYLKPFILKGHANTKSSFFNKAGGRYLLKIGEMIGEQVAMYQQNERKLPVENEFNRNYQRTIRFELPKGYKVTNLEDLNLKLTYSEEDGQDAMGFQSSYEIKGNQVIVYIHEYYKKLDLPLEKFDQFRKVINAAADFNKKVLIFEKT